MNNMPNIDWTKFTWPINNTCTCADCGTSFRSHAKWQNGMWSKDPCPACNSHQLCKVESDPERMELSNHK